MPYLKSVVNLIMQRLFIYGLFTACFALHVFTKQFAKIRNPVFVKMEVFVQAMQNN
jgi:hypothetical protein